MPYVKRTASGRISAVFDRPSRESKERVRANDPELLKFLGLAPTQSVDSGFSAETPASVYQNEANLYQAPAGDYEDAVYEEEVYTEEAFEELPEPPLDSPPLEPLPEPTAAPVESYPEPQAERTPPPPAPEPHTAEPHPTDSGTATDFSLPDNMSDDQFEEDDGFGENFELAAHNAEPPPEPRQESLPTAEPEPKTDEQLFESGDMPSGAQSTQPAPSISTAPPPQPKTEGNARPPAPAKPASDASPEDSGGGEDAKDDKAIQQLDASDLEMARITEDLIDLLIGRNIINFTDFPGMAQRKLITRRALRSNMSALTNLVSDEENIF